MVLKDYIILISLIFKNIFANKIGNAQKIFDEFFILILLKIIIIIFADFANIYKKMICIFK